MEKEKITLSVIKADVGSYTGHSKVHPELLAMARTSLQEACEQGTLIDYYVAAVGDDLELIMTHQKGTDNSEIHQLAWDTFSRCADKAKDLKLYGAGQDLLADAFAGNVRGMGPGVAELEFVERGSEPVVIFMADKTEPGAWNYPLFKMFADPFNTAGLVIDPKMHKGFVFEVHNLKEKKKILFSLPEDMYTMLTFIGAPSEYCIKAVYRKEGNGEQVAVSSTEKLAFVAGRYVGKDDPVCIVRCQSGLPAVGEVLEPFATPHLVAGWMRGSHCGPLMPVGLEDAMPTRFDGPPRVVALGFQLNRGKLVGPVDFFADRAFDRARELANKLADYLRRLGPFEPHRLPSEQMEYTTLPVLLKELDAKFTDI
ncbi:MAG: fructose-1,6-bisphosphate aldolase/phosphatase [Bacillota bacterium]|nr:fructose-1,6-bisphosphate aldolase/phosphatase [Bacillota bacterium]